MGVGLVDVTTGLVGGDGFGVLVRGAELVGADGFGVLVGGAELVGAAGFGVLVVRGAELVGSSPGGGPVSGACVSPTPATSAAFKATSPMIPPTRSPTTRSRHTPTSSCFCQEVSSSIK